MTLTELYQARAAVAGQLAALDMQIKEAEQAPSPAAQGPHLPRMRTLDETMELLREIDFPPELVVNGSEEAFSRFLNEKHLTL